LVEVYRDAFSIFRIETHPPLIAQRATLNTEMKVNNIHQRTVSSPIQPVGELLDSLSTTRDRLWPSESWPPNWKITGFELLEEKRIDPYGAAKSK
jgi:hypothetical protein